MGVKVEAEVKVKVEVEVAVKRERTGPSQKLEAKSQESKPGTGAERIIHRLRRLRSWLGADKKLRGDIHGFRPSF